MSQFYGNTSRFENMLRIRGLKVDVNASSIQGYLSESKLQLKQKIEDNNQINTLLKAVHENPKFIKKRIFFQENIKLLKNADKDLKSIIIDKIIDCKNNEFKILKVLRTLEREL